MCFGIDHEHAIAAVREKCVTDQMAGTSSSGVSTLPIRAQGLIPGDYPQPSQPFELNLQDSGASPMKVEVEHSKHEPGKKSLDRTKLPWYNVPNPVLPPNVRDTLDRKRFYLANAKDIKINILGRANCPALLDNSWHDIIVCNFVDMDKIHLQRDSLEADSEFVQSVGDMESRVRDGGSIGIPSKTIKNQANWIDELEAYETFVAGQFVTIQTDVHHRVIALDKALRKQRNNSCTLLTSPNFQAMCTQQLNPIGCGTDYTMNSSSNGMTVLGHVISVMSVPTAKKNTKQKTVLATGEEIENRYKRPWYMRGFLWSSSKSPSTPSTSSTLLTQPLPPPPSSKLNNRAALDTIKNNQSLFKIVTPINIAHFEELLQSHLNQPYVTSVCCGLQEGFWSHAEIPPNMLEFFDYLAHPQTEEAMAFL
ncbi:hypothetical protein M422DRAFT_260630 [Sphaerobolus stellatus SS14]|uniref:Unplaced genomic scaffold SPHSTscaffold_98, whole genome shotgun sequence n=1 Tax=Sphaerobolus stellatus (strain SS14) TaxID=990650 RepID=A0A0C9VI92_SPHS4|nr:hypothetical protein M422DRAFT_260630 [Sphaerobolus stellatus SS14]